MKNYLKLCYFWCLIYSGFSIGATITQPFNIRLEVEQAVNIEKLSDLLFPDIDTLAHSSPSVDLTDPNAGLFVISGPLSQVVTVSGPDKVNLTNTVTGEVLLTDLVYSSKSITLDDTNGTGELIIGGTIALPTNLVAGTYTSSVTITINYD